MNDPTMHTHRTPDVALWDQYRALREQWTHEDTLVNHRVSWLILSGGLLFTAYRAEAATAGNWLALAFPLFGMLVAGLIGVAIHAALAASDDVRREFERAGLADLAPLAPSSRLARRGRWAAKALPFVFGAMWLLALLGSLRS
ncbi:MAG: hypothetical protein ING89_11480 [Rubrivivax sp.]|jgi:hypothetical protein|nr:hypothetical protein [Rubrivivax sp.]